MHFGSIIYSISLSISYLLFIKSAFKCLSSFPDKSIFDMSFGLSSSGYASSEGSNYSSVITSNFLNGSWKLTSRVLGSYGFLDY